MGELAGIQAVWLREFKVFQRETSRVVASIASPLLWMVLFGAGLGSRVDLGLGRDLSYTTFIFPGVIVMSVLFGTMFYGLYIVWDKKLDFLKEVLAAPVSRTSVFLGKVLGGTTDPMIQSVVMLSLGAVLLGLLDPAFGGIDLLGALLVVPVVFVLAVAVAALGLGLGSMFESFEGFQVVGSFVSFPLFFLSGALYPLDGLPPYLQVLTTLNPMTYAVDLLRTLLLGVGQIPVLTSVLVLLGFAGAMLAFGTFMFHRMK